MYQCVHIPIWLFFIHFLNTFSRHRKSLPQDPLKCFTSNSSLCDGACCSSISIAQLPGKMYYCPVDCEMGGCNIRQLWRKHDKHMVWKGGEMTLYGVVNKTSGAGRLMPMALQNLPCVELHQIEILSDTSQISCRTHSQFLLSNY